MIARDRQIDGWMDKERNIDGKIAARQLVCVCMCVGERRARERGFRMGEIN